MRRLTAILLATLLLAACDDSLRDLYGVSRPLLYIEADWMPTLQQADMSQNATALFYLDGRLAHKEYFLKPNSITAAIPAGTYDILLFNGLMYSPEQTHLDDIYFCGTESPETFEACVKEAPSNKRLLRQDGEMLASCEMEPLTTYRLRHSVEGEEGFYVKYNDGRKTGQEIADYVEDSLCVVPFAVTYEAQIKVHLTHPSSAAVANGALRGMAGSVFMATRKPSLTKVTHQLKLNNLRITHPGTPGDPSDPERGTIESPLFFTFGPPVDDPARTYEFVLSIVLKNGSTIEKTFDISPQIKPVVEQIRARLEVNLPIQIDLEIPIAIDTELPEIIDNGDSGSIGVGDWGDDEIIHFPVT